MTQTSGYQFGTFKGVFTPSLLTILGVIMYLRIGWVLGNVGLPLTLLIVTMSSAITFLTALGIAATASNMRVGIGGLYYIISRSLGVEVGAAIGIPLFLAKALGISFYIVGFSESIAGVWPWADPVVVGVVTLVGIAILAGRSADLALRTQYAILAVIGVSLASIFLGGPPGPTAPPAAATEPTYAPFWIVFAVFFPAVTGIEAGVSMSGDLKDPGRSLARGTIAAVLAGYAVYMAIPIFLAAVVSDRVRLVEDPMLLREVAWWGDAVLLGLWGASLSSAMGAVLGAPRTLQPLAMDGVVPRILGRTYGKGKDPRIAAGVSFAIALAGIVLGDLNAIAPVLSMFFLTAYGLLNLSAALEAVVASPHWRPTLKLPWQLHLAGALACFGAMLMINAVATFLSLAVAAAVFVLMKRRDLRARWGDVWYGVSMTMIQTGLRRIARRAPQLRTWKPNILVLSGVPTARWYLVELAHAISQDRSLMTVATVLHGERASDERVHSVTDTIEKYLEREEVDALVTVLRADTMSSGLNALVSAYGFGPLVPNTIMLGETGRMENLDEYVGLIGRICKLRRNLVIVRDDQRPKSDNPVVAPASPSPVGNGRRNGRAKRIDVWWRGKGHNAGLMLALAYQLRRSDQWRDHTLVLKTIAGAARPTDGETDGTPHDRAVRRLAEFVKKERVKARVEVVDIADEDPFNAIRRSSGDAGLVMLGIRPPEPDESVASYKDYYRTLLRRTQGFPKAMFIFAAEDLPFMEMFST